MFIQESFHRAKVPPQIASTVMFIQEGFHRVQREPSREPGRLRRAIKGTTGKGIVKTGHGHSVRRAQGAKGVSTKGEWGRTQRAHR